MTRNYSRLSSLEERRNVRKAILFGLLSICIVVLLFFYGLPIVAKFLGFVTDLRKTSTPITKTDTTPPAPPRFENLPLAVNKPDLEIEGTSEQGATISLTFNGKEVITTANSDGKFIFSLKLIKGENTIYAKAKDTSGNESIDTDIFKVIFDDTAPEINITSPSDGSQFFGSKQKQLSIKGSTKIGSSLTINDRFVKVNDDGNFVFTTTLNEGSNSFNIKSVDSAQNFSEKTITVNFVL